jgi:DNA-binding transcriptional LysR family regulator
MNDLKAMRVFVEVARRGSFAAAARSTGLSTSSVSRLVRDLEDQLDTSLMRRTARSVTLTDAGEQFLERCADIVSAVDGLQIDARAMNDHPKGMLNVAAAAYPARKRIAPLLPRFLERYPDVQLNMHLQDQPVSLIDEGIDVAFRIGHLADSSMIARKCCEVALRLTVSSSYLDRHELPKSIDELPSFPCLVDTTPSHGRRWPVGRHLNVNGPIAANDGEIIHQMTLAGLGISLLPDFFVDDDIKNGNLISLFADDIDETIGMYLLFPSHRQLSSAARVFMDFMAEQLNKRAE